MTMPQLRSIVNDSPATATDVQWNFGTLETYVNASLVERNGSGSMSGPLTLSGNPTLALHAVPKQYVDSISGAPVGAVLEYGGATAPAGWLLCDGSIYDNATYPVLASVLANAFNLPAGPGGTQFRVPDARDRTSMGVSGTKARASTGGSADSALPSHTHPLDGTVAGTVSDGTHQHNTYIRNNEGVYVTNGGSGGGRVQVSGPGSSIDYTKPTPAGEGTHGHTLNLTVTGTATTAGVSPTNTNLPPYLALSKIIKAD
jgi:microcystin-dependent protein